MRRPLFFLWAVLLLAVAGCGKDDASQETAADAPGAAGALPPAEVRERPSDAAIDEPAQQFPVAGLFLNPYFDDDATETALALSAGSQFRVHIFAETVEPYATNAIQYRLSFPDGVRVLGTQEFEHKSVSTGSYDSNYMLAYDCQPAGRFRLVTYLCQTEAGFKGGEIRVLEGLPASGIAFLGFVTCEFVELRATGGTAALSLK